MSDWFLYVLLCADWTYYCGISNDVERRVRRHNTGQGARYTSAASRRPAYLIFSVGPFTHRAAAQLEIKFKRLSTRELKREFMQMEGKLWTATQEGNEVLLVHHSPPKKKKNPDWCGE